MIDTIHDDLALERIVKDQFGLDVDISQVIVRQIPISHTGEATVFLTNKKQLYAYVHAQSRLVLGDVKKVISRMGLVAEQYLPPHAETDYFDAIGRQKFREVFPGRGNVTDNDIVFYRTMAPYNPALVQIHEVKDGEIKQFDTDASGNWRTVKRFAYRRIKTS